jgi:asparaginyl-tRNA synthetase
MEVNDGSCLANMQVVGGPEDVKGLTTGASVRVTGDVSLRKGKNEIHADTIETIGSCDGETYPLQKKGHSLEFLREHLHLRARTNTFGAMMRMRNAASHGVHSFFQDQGFLHVHTPILTPNDAEGAGEIFSVARAGAGPDKDFFDGPAYLAVSGQLEAEMFASALSKVYTFGPTFRAENSNTSRHLAEFWMVEPELVFTDLDGLMDLAEDCVKSTVQQVLERCDEDAAFLGTSDRLRTIVEGNFVRMTYTEAVEVLQRSGVAFEQEPVWGCSLQSEHEKYIAGQHCRAPVFITQYPSSVKPFYMRASDGCDDERRTVEAVDLLMPDLVSGSGAV